MIDTIIAGAPERARRVDWQRYWKTLLTTPLD
jgi:hypothetical protein